MPEPADPYKTLQVDPEAEDEVVQAAYRRLARKYHPDVAPDPASAARMIAINEAWSRIGDPVRRAAYDAARAAEHRHRSARPEPPKSSAPAATGPASSPRSTTPAPGPAERPPESVSRDWTSGRSTSGSGYDPSSMRAPEGLGAAGPPPGNPSGSVLTFGRYAGWSLGEVARHDLEFLEWLDRAPIGRQYREEVDTILRRTGRRRSAESQATERRGLFRRR